LVPNNELYPKGTVRLAKLNGIKMLLKLDDYVGHFYYFGFQDVHIECLMSLVKPDSKIIDVRANIGYTSLRFSAHLGPNGKVIAFEPDQINYSRCEHNINLNGVKNIELRKKGLGSQLGVAKLEVATEKNRG